MRGRQTREGAEVLRRPDVGVRSAEIRAMFLHAQLHNCTIGDVGEVEARSAEIRTCIKTSCQSQTKHCTLPIAQNVGILIGGHELLRKYQISRTAIFYILQSCVYNRFNWTYI